MLEDHQDRTSAVHAVGAGLATLLDVRGEDEWNDIRAEGAIHWPLARLRAGDTPEDVSLEMPVYVYGTDEGKAEEARDLLIAQGFIEVVNIGGLSDWQQAGGEIE